MSNIGATDFPIDPNTTSGSDLAGRLNRFERAFSSNNAGNIRPQNTTTGGLWTRLNVDGSKDVMMYDGNTDVVISAYDQNGDIDYTAIMNELAGYDGVMDTASNTVLVANAADKVIIISGTNAQLTLPPAASVKLGSRLRIINQRTAPANVIRAGTDGIGALENTINTVTVGSHDTLEVVSDGVATWLVVGGSASLQFSKGAFATGVVGASGWYIGPNKIASAFGSGITLANGTAIITFPITFSAQPTVVLTCAAYNSACVALETSSATQMNISGYSTNTAAKQQISYQYIATGGV